MPEGGWERKGMIAHHPAGVTHGIMTGQTVFGGTEEGTALRDCAGAPRDFSVIRNPHTDTRDNT